MASWRLEYSIDVDDEQSIVRVKIYGQWRKDTAESYHDDFCKETGPLLGRPWAKLIDLSNWKTSRDEVTEVIGKHMSWSVANGVSLSIYVINNPSTYRQLNEMFTKGGTKGVSHTFRTMDEAERFLEEHWYRKRKQA